MDMVPCTVAPLEAAPQALDLPAAVARFAALFDDVCGGGDFKTQIIQYTSTAAADDALRLAGERVSADLLTPENAARLLKAGRGIHRYLVGPEAGVRQLVHEAVTAHYEGLLVVTAGAARGTSSALDAAATRFAATPASQLLCEALLGIGKDTVAGWKDTADRELAAVFAAEANFPSQPAFAGLKARLVVSTPGAAKPARVGLKVAPGLEEDTLLMGYMEKLSVRRGVWQRRWVTVDVQRRTLTYTHLARDGAPTAVLPLAGASLVERGDELVFQVVAAGAAAQAPPRGGPKRLAAVTLRAVGPRSAAEWRGAVAAAVRGERKAEPLPAERKISTRVYPDDPGHLVAPRAGAAADAAAGGDEDGDGAAAAARRAEDALIAEIAAQAAAPPSAADLAAAEAVVEVVDAYVADARARLAELASKIVAQAFLGRREDMYAALLAVLDGGGGAPGAAAAAAG